MKDYHINIFYSNEDGCYVADLPDFHYCSAFGDTPEEALRELQIAKTGWLKAAKKNGYPIPIPSYHPPVVSKLATPAKTARRTTRRTTANL